MNSPIYTAKESIKHHKPIILCLTNVVTMDFMANSLLALGAAPIMSCDDRELKELISISHAVNINIGTLDAAFISRCKQAVDIARRLQKPVILDPVGAGASIIRTQSALELMQFSDIIRGNASEIMALLDMNIESAGVESTKTTHMAKDSADMLARKLKNTIIVSGKEDYITDGLRHEILHYGSPLMPLVTGMGCTLTAVVAAFRAILPDSFDAARLATAYFGLCGNRAEEKASTPGAFRTAFIDALYSLDTK